MTYSEFSSKKENKKSVIRVVHNRENPFVQLNKQALWDQNLSLRAVGLWARCMSRPDNWEFSMKELAEKCKEGREALATAMKEVIAAGYGIRIQYSLVKGGRFIDNGIHYVFFEFPATEQDKIDQIEFFKKSFRETAFQVPGFPNPENPQLLIKILTEKESNEKDNTPPIPPQKETKKKTDAVASGECVSPSSKDLTEKTLALMKQEKPTCKLPDKLSEWHSSAELLLARGISIEQVLKVLLWAFRDKTIRGDWKGWSKPFWHSKNKLQYLHDRFDALESDMEAKSERKFAPSSDDDKSLDKMKKWMETAL